MSCTLNTVGWKRAVIPAAGIVVAAAIPLAIYAVRDRHERVAIEAVQQVQRAQEVFRAQAGAYASHHESLMTPCGSDAAALGPAPLRALAEAGYVLSLRPARGAVVSGQDCHGRPLVSDYYVSAAPRSAATMARQAVAATGSSRLFLFYDGVAPRETDIESGLATPVETRESFKIP